MGRTIHAVGNPAVLKPRAVCVQRATAASTAGPLAPTDLTDEDVALIAACCERWWPHFHRLYGGDCAVFGGDSRLPTRAIVACLWEAGVRDGATIDRIIGASGLISEVPLPVRPDEDVVDAGLTVTGAHQGTWDELAPFAPSTGNG